MARPLIDFIHVDDLPWQEAQIPGSRQPGRSKRLSQDAETGGTTSYLELPPGWRSDQPGYDVVDEEIFVLAGDLTVGDQALTKYSYLFVPGGFCRQRSDSANGATLLSYRSRQPRFVPAGEHGPMYQPDRFAGEVQLENLPYEQPKSAGFPAGAGRKTLRLDEAADESTWVLGILPLWTSPLIESHTYTEEIFILEGTIDTTEGRMTPGSYLVHPPGALHGPMGSRTGCFFINRAYGPWGNTFTPVSGYRLPPEEERYSRR